MSDIEETINDLSLKYKRIVFEGHSLAGSLIGGIRNHQLLEGILFWDSYITKIETFTDVLQQVNLKDHEYMQVNGYKPFLISKEYTTQITESSNTYMQGLLVPYLAVCCEKVGFYDHWRLFDREENNQNTVLIRGSGHEFQERGAQEELFEISNQFIKNILK